MMVEPVLFGVGQLGAFLATRSRGREGRERLDVELVDRAGVDLTIDFTSVSAMTFSFVDEFLGKFLSAFAPSMVDATVKLAGLNVENLEAVTICLERRDRQVVNLGDDGALHLLGDEMLAETFEAAVQLGSFRANDLAAALSLSPQNVNNRLKRLTDVGALRKGRVLGSTRGGREFRYEVPPAQLPDSQALASA
jgi:hypothetical protein